MHLADLVSMRVTYLTFADFTRSTAAWSDCDVSNQTSSDASISCGTGNQVRDVTCVERDTMNNYIQTVNDTFCDAVRRPAAIRNCDLPCPG